MSGARQREAIWLAIVSGEDRSLWAVLARAALTPLAWLYGGVVSVYRKLYEWRWLRTTRLPCVTMSVGNLTVGGTGKSTTVRWLVRELLARGLRPAVLSYGYHGKASREATTVVSDGERILVPVASSGDEPRMLAEALPGVPVLAGARRVQTGQRAVEEFGADVVLLDDGFQYWRLEKDLEIVLVDARCPFGYDHLLPRGLLRERLRAFTRADVVLLMNGHRLPEAPRQKLKARLRDLAPRALQLEGRHRVTGLRSLLFSDRGARGEGSGFFAPAPLPPFHASEEGTKSLLWLQEKRVVALSSLGNPEGFEQTLQDLGVAAVEARRFPDHHVYTAAEAEQVLRLEHPWEAVITTAKDAPKLVAALEHAHPEFASDDRSPGRTWSTVTSHVWVLEVDLDLEGEGAELIALFERAHGALRARSCPPDGGALGELSLSLKDAARARERSEPRARA